MLLLNRYLKTIVLLTAIQLFFFRNVISQNLIQNGSFENYTNIDCTYGGFVNNSPPNNDVVDNWYGLSSPDYFNAVCPCSTSVYNSFVNVFGNISPHFGNAYAGFLTYLKGGEIKEYIYQQLSQPLQSGKVYCLSFFVSKSDRVPYSVANIGAYFSNNVQSTGSFGYVNKTPQIINQTGFITDTIGWTEIQGCYTASGGEQYITIGKFSTTGTDTLNSGTTNPIPFNPDMSYYFIDDITLIDQTTVGINELSNGSSVSVYPNPANSILNITDKYNQLQNSWIEIQNNLGQVVFTSPFISQIDLQNLSVGMYFLTFKGITSKTIKIIKE